MKKFDYSIRKHSTGFTISCGNMDEKGAYIDDGSYKDLVSFAPKDQALAESFLCGLTLGTIKLK